MRLGTRWVRSIAALLIAALLSMQWAAAAHACEALSGSLPAGRAAHSSGCAGAHLSPMKSAQALPCAAHCSIDQQNCGAGGIDVPAFASYFMRAWFAVEPLDRQGTHRAMSLALDTGPAVSAPPIYLLQRSLLN
jgi:hypothetical protein